MGSLVTDKGVLHFETIGRGQPLILLHCWIGSWQFWRETMEYLVARGDYRVYALDFWGFGESAPQEEEPHEAYALPSFVSMVEQFMDEMGIGQTAVFGHSMGGTVALSLALKHQKRVRKVAVVGSPIDGRSLSILLKLSARQWIARWLWRFPPLLDFIMWGYSPWIARDRGNIYQMTRSTLSQATVFSFSRSIDSLRRTNLAPDLFKLRMPALGIYGLGDYVVDPNQADLMETSLPQAEVKRFDDSRHFPMLDESERFNQTLLNFLSRR
ncbi:MAG: alpha/beta hydrolase [Anaerolineae bacterium]|jgi:pimeloyl-ACP methyl ester carboxylesterase